MRLPLLRLLPRLGVVSRGEARRLLDAGSIRVNGAVATDLAREADPRIDRIDVLGRDVREFALLPPIHLVLNKPVGVITTVRDPGARRTVLDFVPEPLRRARPVGRLDRDSSGLLLFTTDGLLGHAIAAEKRVEKVYRVVVNGRPEDDRFAPLRSGIELDGVRCDVVTVEVVRRAERSTELRVVLREGKHRQIRRSMQRIGLRVFELERVAIGPVELRDLAPGAHRALTETELAELRALTL